MNPAGGGTIAAVATPPAPAGLGVVRISGPQAIAVAESVFRPFSAGKRLADRPGYTALYGHAADADGVIDECVALLFRAPKSYTGEDTVELSCHGGRYLLDRVLRACIAAGARPAGPGEFTRRAFLNGKLDLAQAEAVTDLIAAEGRLAARSALAAREGALARALSRVRDTLAGLSAQLTAFVDYPDDDIPELAPEALADALRGCLAEMDALLSRYEAGRILREGVDTAIVGAPNVGKSTLMNWLSGFERSIVTDVAGTTRDIVEETVRVGEVTLRLADTAGLRDTDDPVEAIGVARARGRLQSAALILAVFDLSRPFSDGDRALLAALPPAQTVALLNKCDCSPAWDGAAVASVIPETVVISARAGEGEAALAAAVARVTGVAALAADQAMLTSARQFSAAQRCRAALLEAQSALCVGATLDAVDVCLEGALAALLELTGERVTDVVVDEVFARFCVGK